jgi:hypothetical protein
MYQLSDTGAIVGVSITAAKYYKDDELNWSQAKALRLLHERRAGFFRDCARKKWPLKGSCQFQKLELKMPNPDKPEITNYKNHLILKLGK